MSVVVVAPGMPLGEVVRRSSPEIGILRQPDGWAIAQPRGPHGVLVEQAAVGFVLAEGLFTVIEALDGRVVRLVASPQLELLDFERAWRNARMLAATLHDAGWHARVRFANPDGVDTAGDTLLGRWTAIDWRVELVLRRAIPIGSAPDEGDGAAWLLSVRVEEEAR